MTCAGLVAAIIYLSDGTRYNRNSYGFRPRRGVRHAIQAVTLQMTDTQRARKGRWVIEGDLASYFDEVHHRKLVSCVKRRIRDRRLIHLLWRLLRAGHVDKGMLSDFVPSCSPTQSTAFGSGGRWRRCRLSPGSGEGQEASFLLRLSAPASLPCGWDRQGGGLKSVSSTSSRTADAAAHARQRTCDPKGRGRAEDKERNGNRNRFMIMRGIRRLEETGEWNHPQART